jgi:6,7-dimethyl-8-ribityllumazine synthase
MRFALIVSRFNQEVTEKLLDGARQYLDQHQVGYEVFRVAGAFEIPLMAEVCAGSEEFDGIVCLGAVIRGETSHFDYVAGECARGIREVSMNYALPVGFGVLTTDNDEQALARAGGAHGNKGAEAAQATLEMAELLQRRFALEEVES